MVDIWQPNATQTATHTNTAQINVDLLQQIANLSDDVDAIFNALTAEQQQYVRQWIQLSEQEWQAQLPHIEESALFPIAQFYTLAEMKLSGFEAGKNNPAIWIFRYLKQQQKLPEKSDIRALKAQTDNRFIPYGSVL